MERDPLHVWDTLWPVPDHTHASAILEKTKLECPRLPYKYVYMNSELGVPGIKLVI